MRMQTIRIAVLTACLIAAFFGGIYYNQVLSLLVSPGMIVTCLLFVIAALIIRIIYLTKDRNHYQSRAYILSDNLEDLKQQNRFLEQKTKHSEKLNLIIEGLKALTDILTVTRKRK